MPWLYCRVFSYLFSFERKSPRQIWSHWSVQRESCHDRLEIDVRIKPWLPWAGSCFWLYGNNFKFTLILGTAIKKPITPFLKINGLRTQTFLQPQKFCGHVLWKAVFHRLHGIEVGIAVTPWPDIFAAKIRPIITRGVCLLVVGVVRGENSVAVGIFRCAIPTSLVV